LNKDVKSKVVAKKWDLNKQPIMTTKRMQYFPTNVLFLVTVQAIVSDIKIITKVEMHSMEDMIHDKSQVLLRT